MTATPGAVMLPLPLRIFAWRGHQADEVAADEPKRIHATLSADFVTIGAALG